jgi:hypothetical protein
MGTVVFCCFHPAAGFRSPEASALVSYDFAQLAVFAAGGLKPRKLYDDPYPNPHYELLKGAENVCRVLHNLWRIDSGVMSSSRSLMKIRAGGGRDREAQKATGS